MTNAAEGRHRAPAPAGAAASSDSTVTLSPTVELLVEAVAAVAADLDLDGVLHRTLEAACVLTGAPAGTLSLVGDERSLLFGSAASGGTPGADSLRRTVLVRGTAYARLRLAAKPDGRPFDARDELMLDRLVAAAGPAIGNALDHRAGVSAERERIARDLHDTVIQRLYATGMQLQAARRGAAEGPEAVLGSAVRDLDGAMRDLRATVFELRRGPSRPLLAEVEALIEEYAGPLGFRPDLRHSGPVDAAPSRATADQLLATLREALSNVLKHARATTAAVELHASSAWVLLRVRDDGVGIEPGQAGVLGSGLANLRARAESLGGVLRMRSDGIDWLVPAGR